MLITVTESKHVYIMKSSLFNEPKSLATAIDESLSSTRAYKRTQEPKKYYNPKYARFKLWVQIQGGKKLTRYSFDEIYCHEKQKEIRDEFNGLIRLIRLISSYDNVVTAVIYASDCPVKKTDEKNYNIEVYKMVRNSGVTKNKFVSFDVKGTLDLSKFTSSNSRLSRG